VCVSSHGLAWPAVQQLEQEETQIYRNKWALLICKIRSRPKQDTLGHPMKTHYGTSRIPSHTNQNQIDSSARESSTILIIYHITLNTLIVESAPHHGPNTAISTINVSSMS